MQLKFYKYQGTGNDFVILDNRDKEYSNLTTKQINLLCDRKFGIGADGLILLNSAEGYDFEMKYFNADGKEGSMCGNGGRCLVKFAWHQGIRKSTYKFIAFDGEHEAEIDDAGTVSLHMKDVNAVMGYHGDQILDTGSPHYVKIVDNVMNLDVVEEGKTIRNNPDFVKEGINVNFVQHGKDDEITVRTYERGVEDETLSCGTGVTASALVCYHNERGFNSVSIITRGGKVSVEYDRMNDYTYQHIRLRGPAEKVFEGTFELED